MKEFGGCSVVGGCRRRVRSRGAGVADDLCDFVCLYRRIR